MNEKRETVKNMKEIILIKLGEIVLKGLNRKNFEDKLLRTLRRRLGRIGSFKIRAAQSTIFVEPMDEDIDMDEVSDLVSKVFGIAAFARACVAEKELDKIKLAAVEYLKETMEDAKTFKVEAKRSDKKFPFNSPQICTEVGGYLLEKYPHLSVDVHNPDVIVTVEIRDFAAYVRAGLIRGAGGIPVGTGGKACVLISGGIDSPVASYMMAKRGLELMAVHFASPPYTSQRAEEKVIELLERVARYSGRLKLYIVPFTKIQEQIREKCKEDYFTIIMRRFMMEISQSIAMDKGAQALITGESLGQVASQTIGAIGCTDAVCNMPVFRPLIGMDKEEIIEISRKIDTFDISIQPYEDCCTVFTPKHPRTRPVPEKVADEQNRIEDSAALIAEAIQNVRVLDIHGYSD